MSAAATLCANCFTDHGGAAVCPHCGYAASPRRSPLLLAPLTRLQERFLVGRPLGKPGGFGITYLGFDTTLKTRVAIKEYFPRELVGRDDDRCTLRAHTEDDDALFRYGLAEFLREARTLAQFDHANVVRVRDFFEANGTAYLVMDYYEGVTLATYLVQQGGRLPYRQALYLLLPVLDGLREVHGKGYLHRDVKPQNIYLTSGGRPILLDFGAARQAMGERSRSLSVLLTEGFAPYEQYHRRGRQGPWTDVYGAAATLYCLITGAAPPPATERRVADELQPPSALVAAVPKRLDGVLMGALAVDAEDRPPTIRTFEDQLLASLQEDKPAPEPQPPVDLQPPSGRAGWVKGLMGAVLAAGLVGIGIGVDRLLDGRPGAEGTDQAQEPPPATRELRDRLQDGSQGPVMVKIPAGEFLMGSPASKQKGSDSDERQHRVLIKRPFAMSKYEVTFEEYDQFAEATGRGKPSDQGWGRGRRPVINVSWDDAVAYAQWLAGQTRQQYRLPTEAEWEYAARAGTVTAYWWGDDIGRNRANCDGCGSQWDNKQTAPVASFEANPFGLHDTAGNVWEWTCSAYDKEYVGGGEHVCAEKPDTRTLLLIRGGSWYYGPRDVRSANRFWFAPAFWADDLGFRLAKDL